MDERVEEKIIRLQDWKMDTVVISSDSEIRENIENCNIHDYLGLSKAPTKDRIPFQQLQICIHYILHLLPMLSCIQPSAFKKPYVDLHRV